MGIVEKLLVKMFIMGAKKRAPEPKPDMTIPEARPRLSGNQSIRTWMGGV